MKAVSKAVVVLAVGAAILAAGALVFARPASSAAHVLTDGAAIRVPAETAAVRRVLWNPARPISMVEGENAQEADAYEPRVSADGTRMVFVMRRPGSNADLYMSRWTPEGWSAPEAIVEINSGGDELGPELSWDGNTLYFYSDRDGGLGGYDLWKSMRIDEAWGTPVNLGPEVNSEFNEYGAAESPDGKSLYFASNRPREGESRPSGEGWNATVRERRERHDYDLFRSELREGAAGAAQRVVELNTLHDEGSPAVSPAGDFLYFASDRPGGAGGYDVYRSRILRGVHLAPENVGPGVNSADNELDPGLSTDGFRLYFSTDRELPSPVLGANPGGAAGAGKAANAGERERSESRHYRVWFSDSREVFDEYASTTGEARLGEWWNAVWPWLAMLAAALLVGYLLLALLRNPAWRRRFGRLSLLAQCVLVSLMIHAIAASVLAAWKVGTGIIEMVRQQGSGGGGNRVILTSSGAAGEVAGQVRGDGSAEPIVVPALLAMHAEIESPELEAGQVRTELPQSHGEPAPSLEVSFHDAAPERASEVGRMELPRDVQREPATATPEVAPGMSVAENAGAFAPGPRTAAPRIDDVTPLDSMRQVRLPQRGGGMFDAALRQETADAAPATSGMEMSLAAAAPSDPEARVPRDVGAAPPVSESTGLPAASGVPGVVASVGAGGGVGDLERIALPASSSPPSVIEGERLAVGESDQTTQVTPGEHVGAGIRVDGSSQWPRGQRLPSVSAAEVSGEERGSGVLAAVPLPGPTVSFPDTREGKMQRVAMPASTAKSGGELGVGKIEAPTSATSSGASVPARMEPASSIAAANVGLPTLGGEPARGGGEEKAAGSVTVGTDSGSAPPVVPSGPGNTEGVRISLGAGSRVHATLGVGEAGAPEAADAPQFAAKTGEIGRLGGFASAPVVALPALEPEPITPVETFAQRAPEVREKVLERMGGTADTEAAVRRALDWFTRHQEPDGRWTGRRFDDRCGHCDGEAAFDGEAAMTGMALLCYLGAGHTHQSDGPYRDVVAKALAWLVARQGADGDMRRGEAMYGQTVSTVALCEAFSMTRDPTLAGPARRAVNFVVRVAGRGRGGAAPREEDTSVIGWLVMTVESARRAGIAVPPDTFEAARKWLDYVSSSRNPGLYSYRKGDKPSLAMTAEAMFVQQLLGHNRVEARMTESAAFLLRASPRWEQGAPTYCWYYATLALFEHQGDAWKQWNEALMPQLLEHQRRDAGAEGSWDPQDEWSKMGGRIYQTAVCTLCLEVYYRYKPKGAEVTGEAGAVAPAPLPGP